MPRLITSSAAGSVLLALLCACSDERRTYISGPGLEPPPSPPATQSFGSVWGYVVDSSGICISNVTVEIVSGPGTGRQTVQAVPCDAWAYSNGFLFKDLPLGAALTLRLKSPGYKSQDGQVIVRNSGYADVFELWPE